MLGLGFGVAFGYSHLWPWFQLERVAATVRGELPWNLIAFLDAAHRKGVVRQLGATYEFRHARLQDRLATESFPLSWLELLGTSIAGGGLSPDAMRRELDEAASRLGMSTSDLLRQITRAIRSGRLTPAALLRELASPGSRAGLSSSELARELVTLACRLSGLTAGDGAGGRPQT